MAEKKQIRFMINGKAYTLRHDEPEEYMHRIEHFLNTKVAAAAKADLRLEQQTALVMAAISITDELFKTQKNFNTLKNEIKRMMDEYDRLKIEKQDLDQQLTRAEQQIDTLSKQLLLARHSLTAEDDDTLSNSFTKFVIINVPHFFFQVNKNEKIYSLVKKICYFRTITKH